jgi:hypothetical protein
LQALQAPAEKLLVAGIPAVIQFSGKSAGH